jgi:putative hydrolase of the HAD superfamily
MSHKAVVFDFFGVICSDVAPLWFKGHTSGEDSAALKETYVAPADKGDISEKELFSELSELSSESPDDIRGEWVMTARIHPDMQHLLQELKGKRKLGLLTNATGPFVTSILEQHGLTDLFDAIVISSEIHHAKPEPEAFRAILDTLGVEPEEAIMIDDSLTNIEGAERIGMKGILFRSYEQLQQELARC